MYGWLTVCGKRVRRAGKQTARAGQGRGSNRWGDARSKVLLEGQVRGLHLQLIALNLQEAEQR